MIGKQASEQRNKQANKQTDKTHSYYLYYYFVCSAITIYILIHLILVPGGLTPVGGLTPARCIACIGALHREYTDFRSARSRSSSSTTTSRSATTLLAAGAAAPCGPGGPHIHMRVLQLGLRQRLGHREAVGIELLPGLWSLSARVSHTTQRCLYEVQSTRCLGCFCRQGVIYVSTPRIVAYEKLDLCPYPPPSASLGVSTKL